MNDKPNPGSQNARDAGCICPALDNNDGIRPPDYWWIRPDYCPVHSGADQSTKEQ